MSYIITYGDDQQFQAIMFLLQTAQGMSAVIHVEQVSSANSIGLKRTCPSMHGRHAGTTT